MKKGRKKWIVIVVALIVLAVAGRLLLGGGAENQYAQETAHTGALTTYYNFSGNLDVNQSVTVTAEAAATVSEVYVRANQTVAKNARLMRLSDGAILKADIAGELTALNVSRDSVVKAGETLAEIMDLSNMKATFQVDEFDISAVEIGKTAEITLDGNGYTLQGTVTSINKRATQSGDLSYYTATIDLAGQTLPSDALPGMQITVKLRNRSAENAVLLSMDAISFTSQNAPYVLVQDGRAYRRVDIQVGINDGDFVEITGGIQSGDTVYYTPSSPESYPMMMGGARRYAQ